MNRFPGILVPLVTPFKDGEVDYRAAQRLAAYVVDQGVHGLVVCGTTGEGCSLEENEKMALLEAIMDTAGRRVPVLMGLSGSNTRHVAADAKLFQQTGVDGYLVSAPSYIRPSQDGIMAHFRAVAEKTELPIVLYNIPARTGVNIEPETIAALSESPQFVGVKECGELAQLLALTHHSSCPVLSGDDALIFTALARGASGAIAASAHIRPDLFVQMVELVRHQEFEEARDIFHHLQPLIRLLFSEPNPAPVKAALALQGWIANELRSPMLPVSALLQEKLRVELAKLDQFQPVNLVKAYAA